VKCDILNAEELAGHLAGHDIVLSALGVAGHQESKIILNTRLDLLWNIGKN
jgi:putative NADH-flavin reductase